MSKGSRDTGVEEEDHGSSRNLQSAVLGDNRGLATLSLAGALGV